MHYVMADLHGEFDRYQAMLRQIQFSDADQLYILGDVVDRGGIGGIDILRDMMARPNVTMLLGNHERMCLLAMASDATERARLHWMRNGGGVTRESLMTRVNPEEREGILDFFRGLPDHLDLEVAGRQFHLVHGFPAENTYDRVWKRPALDTPNPFPDGRTVLIGHTPVCEFFAHNEQELEQYLRELDVQGAHLRILHAEGFICMDCCCGYSMNSRRLACLRLEDLAEFYA